MALEKEDNYSLRKKVIMIVQGVKTTIRLSRKKVTVPNTEER